MKAKKKRSSPKIEVFFPRNQVKTKKIKNKKGLHRNLGLYSVGICRIYLCWLATVRIIIQRSNLDGWTSKSRWVDAKSRWGDANSRWGDASPLQFKYLAYCLEKSCLGLGNHGLCQCLEVHGATYAEMCRIVFAT